MRTRLFIAAGGATLAVALALPLTAGAQLSTDECNCETQTGAAQGKFAAAKAKCLAKCNQGARAGNNPATDCTAPYAGTTQECVNKAETKAEATETKCKDCPECYSGGNCTADAGTRTATTETQIDGFAFLVFCDDGASPDQTNDDEAKCEQEAAKAAGKFAAAKAKCYAKCRAAECKGKIPAGSCTAGAVTDPTGKTQDCISKNEAKCVAKIGQKCTDPPECYTNPLVNPPTNLCNAVESAVDANDASTYCSSPSGAFLE